jgi:phosphatidylserine/phosphatidylglycerophosphate/cardiolipin synthase-like enzyme
VDVRVILEKNPYGSTNINKETRLFFQENHIPFHESDHTQFAFMHAKYAIIDDNWIVETANWTRASFASNREFFMAGNEGSLKKNLENIFERDFSGDR